MVHDDLSQSHPQIEMVGRKRADWTDEEVSGYNILIILTRCLIVVSDCIIRNVGVKNGVSIIHIGELLSSVTAYGPDVRGIFHPLHVESVSRVDYMVKMVRRETK